MSESHAGLPARPSLEQLRKRAKDLLRAARSGDATAAARLRAQGRNPTAAQLADAQYVIAREHGFAKWADLIHHIEEFARDASTGALIRPVELLGDKPYTLADGQVVSTEDVYRMFVATRAGDMNTVRDLVAKAPKLAVVEYNYTPPIHFAVREGHLALVEFLLDRGADLAYKSYPFGDTLLMIAEDREHNEIASLLKKRLSQRFAMAEGMKEILEAARKGDMHRVKAELERDPSLAQKSNEVGDTALHHAAHNANLPMVDMLLAAGANPDAIRGDGYRPIHLALMRGWWQGRPEPQRGVIADLLLAKGARYTMHLAVLRHDLSYIRDALRRDRSLANEEDTNHHRPISAAARQNDLALVRLLLDHGADPNLPEEGAERGHALWIAVHMKWRELARLLVEHGADPNGMVESSGTPMMRAEGDKELTELLVAHGGKLERNEERETIQALLKHRRYDEAERRLRERPDLIDVNGDGWGDGILAGPASDGQHEVIAMLMRLGARVPQVSKWAPYYYFKHEATAAFLLENGMDPNHMNWHRLTLLHHMAAEGEMGKAQLLVRHGAEIDAIDEEYRSTPVGLAARRGQLAMLKFLLAEGADPSLAGAPWSTPLAWAKRRGHADVVDALTAAGAA